ncbi:MAG: hypothetical protein DRP09_18750, partial [Candidatus Thorarchaeota archaeon]
FNDYAYGVYGTASSSNYIENIQIENTVINSTGTAGVYFYQYVKEATLNNATIQNGNTYGIYWRYSSYNTINNSKILSNKGHGIYLTASDYCNITTNNISYNGDASGEYGLNIQSGSDNNKIYNNYFHNTYNAYDTGTANKWNTTKTPGTNIVNGPYIAGNYWSDYTGTDLGNDGIGETPYTIQTSGTDYQPLVEQQAQSIAISMSEKLASGINWTITALPAVNESAKDNNGTGVTLYNLSISASGTTVDVYIKADGGLTNIGGDVIGLGNETYSYNLTNSSVPSDIKHKLTTSYSDNKIGENLADGSHIFLKFFLSVPGAQPVGNYSNTISITAVPYGQSP